ncbi:MAG TPA: hypothetical protein VGL40_07340 [Bacillota bacterium]
MLRSTSRECPFPTCRLKRRRAGIVTKVFDRHGRLVEVRCDLNGRGCPLLAALAVGNGAPDAGLALALELIDLFGEDY